VKSPDYNRWLAKDSESWIGLSHENIYKSKYSYPVGVEKIRSFKELDIDSPRKVKHYNAFDGFDIDIDRMYENMNFLVDKIKRKKAPKYLDIYINISEGCFVDYESMLNKAWAAISIVDNLENQGIRCSVFAISCKRMILKDKPSSPRDEYMIEICLKKHNDSLNLGAICAGISPWMFRYWEILWSLGNINDSYVDGGMSNPMGIPRNMIDSNSIVIDKGECFTHDSATQFVKEIQETNKINAA
jgi:hypothetical protein